MDYQQLADSCRHKNMGYCDGRPGTADDIERRLIDLERFSRQDSKVLARLMSNSEIVFIAHTLGPV